MVRSYKRKTQPQNTGGISRALQAIAAGMSTRAAARDFGIPETTLRRQLSRNPNFRHNTNATTVPTPSTSAESQPMPSTSAAPQPIPSTSAAPQQMQLPTVAFHGGRTVCIYFLKIWISKLIF